MFSDEAEFMVCTDIIETCIDIMVCTDIGGLVRKLNLALELFHLCTEKHVLHCPVVTLHRILTFDVLID